jgi:hypothetical protein
MRLQWYGIPYRMARWACYHPAAIPTLRRKDIWCIYMVRQLTPPVSKVWSHQGYNDCHVHAESPGSFLIFRTMQGYLGCSSTSDPTGATNWTTSRFAQHWNATPAAAGRGMKNPRGPITLKRFSNGKYLMLFYFNSVLSYDPRDPYWLVSGIEQDGEIRFSQPEIVLYDYENVKDLPGYPDFIEVFYHPVILHILSTSGQTWYTLQDNNTIYITETNKSVARVHPIDAQMLSFLFAQNTSAQNASNPALTFSESSQVSCMLCFQWEYQTYSDLVAC